MKRHLTKTEQETLLCTSAADHEYEIDTCDPIMIRRLDKLCQEYPDDYKVKKTEYYDDGDVLSRTYITAKRNVIFRKPRYYTDEQLEQMRKNLDTARIKRMQNQEQNVKDYSEK